MIGEPGRVPQIEVLIVSDYRLFAEVLAVALGEMGIIVLDITTSGPDGIAAARRLRPDVVLIDVGLSGVSGLAAGDEVVRELPAIKVMVLLHEAPRREVARDVSRSGIHGFLSREHPLPQLVDGIVAVASGQTFRPTSLAAVAARPESPEEDYWALLSKQLTHREREILALLVKGAGGAEVARCLGITPNTVRTHIQNILTKLQVHSRLEAAALAIRADLIPSEFQARVPAV